MSFNEDVRRAVDAAVGAALAKVRQELVDSVSAAVPEPPPPPPPQSAPAPVAAPAAGGADAPALGRDLFALLDGSGQIEILNKLMEVIPSHWDRSILFLVKGTQFQPWDARGFEGSIGNDAAKSLAVSLTADTLLATALSGEGRQAENGLLEARLGAPKGLRAAVPLGIRNKPAAVLYAEGPKAGDAAGIAVLELLARVTASAIELGMLTKRVPPFVRTEAAFAKAGGPQAAPAAFAMPAPAEPEIAIEAEVEAEVEIEPEAAPAPAAPRPAPAPAPSWPAALPPEPAAEPAKPAASSWAVPTPAAAPPAPAPPPPPAARAAPPAEEPPAAVAATPSIPAGTLDPRELLKGGAKPVVDAGQSMQPSKSYSRWKPVRDQVKAGDEVDPALAAIPEGERPRHVEARKIARLLVSEIKLYNEAKVAVGRKNKDLYERLKEDIEKSRQSYLEKVGADLAGATDYFRDELVATLAEGDAEALGAGR